MQADSASQQRQRADMIAAIRRHVAETGAETGRNALDEAVYRALAIVPRHHFVPVSEQPHAYRNSALPIGWRQTISQPFIVALMTDLLQPAPDQCVLEVGTGSGYQAAVLSRLVDRVYSVERVPELAQQAATTLDRLGYHNVSVTAGDGCLGWPEHAPFDGIMVTAGGPVPAALVEQLKPGGRLVIPVGEQHGTQRIAVLEKLENGTLKRTDTLPVRFVPLVSVSNSGN